MGKGGSPGDVLNIHNVQYTFNLSAELSSSIPIKILCNVTSCNDNDSFVNSILVLQTLANPTMRFPAVWMCKEHQLILIRPAFRFCRASESNR